MHRQQLQGRQIGGDMHRQQPQGRQTGGDMRGQFSRMHWHRHRHGSGCTSCCSFCSCAKRSRPSGVSKAAATPGLPWTSSADGCLQADRKRMSSLGGKSRPCCLSTLGCRGLWNSCVASSGAHEATVQAVFAPATHAFSCHVRPESCLHSIRSDTD